jgi:hypothetical protein
MEAYALAKTCWSLKAPFACAKYVTDGADHTAADDWQSNVHKAADEFLSLYRGRRAIVARRLHAIGARSHGLSRVASRFGIVDLCASPGAAGRPSGVKVIEGATPIQDGEAKSAGDITVVNEKLAFALAVGSPVPYGVPRGAIIDVAPVVNGKVGRDCVVFADFIPDNWSAWPNTFQHIKILERGPARVIIRTERDWGRC